QRQRVAAIALVAGAVPLVAELAGRLGLEHLLAIGEGARLLRRRLGARGGERGHRADRDDRASRDPAGTHGHHRPRLPQSPNTNSIEAVDVFLSSGASPTTNADWRDPPSTAMYCLPPAE